MGKRCPLHAGIWPSFFSLNLLGFQDTVGVKPVELTLKASNKNCSRRHFNFLLLSFEENKAWFFMWILCLAEDSLETSSLIFSEKQWKNIMNAVCCSRDWRFNGLNMVMGHFRSPSEKKFWFSHNLHSFCYVKRLFYQTRCAFWNYVFAFQAQVCAHINYPKSNTHRQSLSWRDWCGARKHETVTGPTADKKSSIVSLSFELSDDI